MTRVSEIIAQLKTCCCCANFFVLHVPVLPSVSFVFHRTDFYYFFAVGYAGTYHVHGEKDRIFVHLKHCVSTCSTTAAILTAKDPSIVIPRALCRVIRHTAWKRDEFYRPSDSLTCTSTSDCYRQLETLFSPITDWKFRAGRWIVFWCSANITGHIIWAAGYFHWDSLLFITTVVKDVA